MAFDKANTTITNEYPRDPMKTARGGSSGFDALTVTSEYMFAIVSLSRFLYT